MHTTNRERWPARPYSRSGAGSGVVLRHRTVAVACACLTVDAAVAEAYCMPEGAAQIRPADGFLHNHCPNSRGFYKKLSSNIFFYNEALNLQVIEFGSKRNKV